jgi:hypothetical protein
MQFTSKEYKILKTKNYIKENKIFFFFNSINRNSNDSIIVEQNLKKLNFDSYKIYNKTSKKTLKASTYKNSTELVNSITLLIKPMFTNFEIKKSTLLQSFEPLLFSLLAIKVNNKIYSKNQLKEIFLLNYKDIKLLFFQFGITNSKLNFKTKKIQ